MVAVLALSALPPRTAYAQQGPRDAQSIETARDLYNQGKKLRDQGELKAALDKFKAAHALAHTPITGLDLAKTHAALNQPVDAREVCLDIARTPVAREETPRSAEARREAAKLAEQVVPQIASIAVRVEGLDVGQIPRVTVDQNSVPFLALSELRKVNPGTHSVTASVDGGTESEESVEVKPGETKSVVVTVIQPEKKLPPLIPVPVEPQRTGPTPLPIAPPSDEPPKKSPLVAIGITTTIVGAAVGSITGIVALSKKSDLSTSCPNRACLPGQYSALDSAKAFGIVSTIGFGVGLVGGVLWIVGETTSKKSAPTPSSAVVTPYVSTQGAGLYGRF